MTVWLSEVPSWLSFVTTLAIANAVGLCAMAIARRWSLRIGVSSGPAVVNSWATCAGALCAVLFAFSIVSLWNGASRARANADDEGTAVRLVARDVAPSQLGLLRAYVNASVAEWPQLCAGTRSGRADRALRVIERRAAPRSPAYASDLERQLTAIEDLRERRWQIADSGVPDEVWVALLVLAGAVLAVLAVAMPERRETHVVLMVAVASALGTLFWVTALLEYPFCGSGAIGPNEFAALASPYLR